MISAINSSQDQGSTPNLERVKRGDNPEYQIARLKRDSASSTNGGGDAPKRGITSSASPDQDIAAIACPPTGDPDQGVAATRTMVAQWTGSEAPIDSRVYAPASRSSPVTPANGGTMSCQPLPAQYESAIEAIARASVNLPNPEAWRLVLEALRSRYSAAEATPLRQHVWRRRKAMQKQRKASIRQALTPARAG